MLPHLYLVLWHKGMHATIYSSVNFSRANHVDGEVGGGSDRTWINLHMDV